jgi:hypothetical protein
MLDPERGRSITERHVNTHQKRVAKLMLTPAGVGPNESSQGSCRVTSRTRTLWHL